MTNPYTFTDESEHDYNFSSPHAMKNRELREFQLELFDELLPRMVGAKSVEEVNELLRPFNARVKDLGPSGRYRYELYSGGGNSMFSQESYIDSESEIYLLFTDEAHLQEEILDISEEYGDDNYYFTTDSIVNLVIAMNEYRDANYDGIFIPKILDTASMFAGVGTDIVVMQVIDTLSMIDRDTGKNKALKEEIAVVRHFKCCRYSHVICC